MRLAVMTAVLALVAAAPAGARPQAPGAPGKKPTWAPADKHGFGTSTTGASRVWFTLRAADLSEVYYPTLGTPSVRGLEFAVGGRSFVERETRGATTSVTQSDRESLTYTQVTTSRRGRWRLTKTYVTDPARATVLLRVHFESLTGAPLRLYVLLDPQLSNDGRDDRASARAGTLVARDKRMASALSARPRLREATSGYLGRSDGWRDLRRDGNLDHRYRASRRGNVAQAARAALTGLPGAQDMTLALAFARRPAGARRTAAASLAAGFDAVAASYANGWHAYRATLKPAPAAAAPVRQAYETSVLLLRAHEDKAHPGASVASPTMPWAWGALTLEKPKTAPYHLVWSRDLYQVATAQIAAGDAAAATRSLDFLLFRQQKRDGSFPQNSQVDGGPKWTNTQLDEVALPIVLAWQLGAADARHWARIRRAAGYLVRKGPKTPQERWENQEGYSPGTIAAEIAGLVCAADIARRNGDAARAGRYERVADRWAANVQRWTATTNGPYRPAPYYLRLTKDRKPNTGTRYAIGDGGPKKADQRRVVDPSFLELVRLGIKRPDDQVIRNTLAVVDDRLGVQTANGQFWHRFTFDGYGETRDGGPWDVSKDNTFRTLGRVWPIFAGERGEYELLAGTGAPEARLEAMAAAGNDGGMIPEQVWDGRPPTAENGRAAGEGTLSATPLAWSHAQLVRLAWSIDAGRPVEQPGIVACRYTGRCG